MKSFDLDSLAIVSLRDPNAASERRITVFAGSYGRALMFVAAMPASMRERAVVETRDADLARERRALAC